MTTDPGGPTPERRAREIRRRRFLAVAGVGGAATLALADTRVSRAARPVPVSTQDPNDSRVPLRLLASRRGIRFGTEIVSAEIDADPAYRSLIARECASVTPGLEAKWNAVEPAPGRFRYAPLDTVVDFAAAHGMAVRMHTLVWGPAMPPWLDATLRHGTRAKAEAALARHVAAVVGRYRGRVRCWDVCNELSDPLWHRGPEGLTMTPWRRALGPAVVPLAFALTRQADPDAILFVNEDGLEWQGARFDEKRLTYLRLLEAWLRQGVPIGGFGLQTHLGTSYAFDPRAYRRFLADLASLGLVIDLTELDVRDRDLPADPAARDRAAADLVRRVLDVALDERAVAAVTTWGLADRYTYENTDRAFARDDGLPSRPLPFDADLRAKPMRDAIARAFAGAPDRRAPVSAPPTAPVSAAAPDAAPARVAASFAL